MGGMEQLLAQVPGWANMAGQAGAAGTTAGTAVNAAGGIAGTAGGVAETAGALSGAPDATLAGGAAKMAEGAALTAGAEKGLNAFSFAENAPATAAGTAGNGVDPGMLDKMKLAADQVGEGFWNGLSSGDKVFTKGTNGVDWTQTLSKAAGRAVQGKLVKALGGSDARWKMELSRDFYKNYAG